MGTGAAGKRQGRFFSGVDWRKIAPVTIIVFSFAVLAGKCWQETHNLYGTFIFTVVCAGALAVIPLVLFVTNSLFDLVEKLKRKVPQTKV